MRSVRATQCLLHTAQHTLISARGAMASFRASSVTTSSELCDCLVLRLNRDVCQTRSACGPRMLLRTVGGGELTTARALTHNRHFFSPCHDVVAQPPWSGSTGLATCREGRFVLTEGLLVCQTGWHHGYFMRLFYGV